MHLPVRPLVLQWIFASSVLRQSAERGLDIGELVQSFDIRSDLVHRYIDAYRHYCWPVKGIDDIKLAPFHIMATEGIAHADKTHLWHMETLAELCKADPQLLLATAVPNRKT